MTGAIAAFALGLSLQVAPGELDPTRVHRFVLAPPAVPTRMSSHSLPRNPIVRWRVRVAGGLVHPPSVATDGSILVAHTLPHLAQYDGAGRLQWTARLGASPAATSPVELADGTRLVLTEGAEALAFSERGTWVWSQQLPQSSFEKPPALAGTEDGSLLIADGRRLVRLDGGGKIAYISTFEQEITATLGGTAPAFVIGAAGAVAAVALDGRLEPLVDLRGRVDAAARLGDKRLMVVLDGKRLIELDCDSRRMEVRFADTNLELLSALAVNQVGELRLLAAPDLLLAFSTDGSERFRAPLPTPSNAGLPRGASDLLLDPTGSTLVVRPGMDATSVQPDGSVARIDATACSEPLRPVALPGNGALLACRSGVLSRADEAKK